MSSDFYVILPPADIDADDLLDFVYEAQDSDVVWTPTPDDVNEEILAFYEEITVRCPSSNDPENPLDEEESDSVNAVEYLFTENICHMSAKGVFPEEMVEFIEAIAQKNDLVVVSE